MMSRCQVALGIAASLLLGLCAKGGELPKLVGDGVVDDTAAIQARLDSGAPLVYLPPPAKHYLISKPLRVGSGQELRLDRFTLVRLAPGSNCAMLENRNWREGDRQVAIVGGIWDMANAKQAPNPIQTKGQAIPNEYQRDFFMGICFRFDRVSGLTIRDLTIMNPVTFSIQLCRVDHFLVEGITFDFQTWNPIRLNMDGIHLDGGCHHGRVANLRGTCFDDMVALNANDGADSPYQGEISDIDIDGIYAEYCHSAVRMLSTGAPVRRVTISNVHGHFYVYTVGFTHYYPGRPRGIFEDIHLENIFTAKALSPADIGVHSRASYPVIQFQGPVDCGTVTIRNLSRVESTLPTATIGIDPAATIRHLTLDGMTLNNHLKKPIPVMTGRDRVKTLIHRNIELLPSTNAYTHLLP